MHVVFVEPAFPRNQREFPRALRATGARVTGIGEAPLEALDDELKSWLSAYHQVSSVVNVGAMHEIVSAIQRREPVHRIEASVEAHITPTARVRQACGIPGTSVEVAHLCRDKPAMKEWLRKAGVPCAQSLGSSSVEEIVDFAETVGYPLIIKPRDAAGAAGTHRVEDIDGLKRALAAEHVPDGASVAVEEYIEGHEGFYDTITVDGKIVHEFISHYYPGVLEAMRTRWISPQFIATNRVGAESYGEVREMGRRVIESIGIETSATHMEWFYGPKGLKFSEIGCRPPGVGAWDLYCHGNELDVYQEWAMAIVHGRPSRPPSRRYAAGLINLRPDRDGTIVGYEGWDAIERTYGEWIIDYRLPGPGTGTQPVEAGYMANAWLRMKHPDYDHLRHMLDTVGETVQVRAR